jgi:hypothetical protein
VQVLITIDPAGLVSAVETLTGDAAVRPAVIDAVKRWRYRPVFRDGTPVYAYTIATVHPDPAAPFEFDREEERAAGDRWLAVSRRFKTTPEQVLADEEQDHGVVKGVSRAYALLDIAKAALKAEDYEKAANAATEALTQGDKGQSLHDAHIVLGQVALRRQGIGSLQEAREHLLTAGTSKGSPSLGSFGPNMSLAKELLDKGERDVVLAYFELCRKFWTYDPERVGEKASTKLDQWSAAVRAGKAPNFGLNLRD